MRSNAHGEPDRGSVSWPERPYNLSESSAEHQPEIYSACISLVTHNFCKLAKVRRRARIKLGETSHQARIVHYFRGVSSFNRALPAPNFLERRILFIMIGLTQKQNKYVCVEHYLPTELANNAPHKQFFSFSKKKGSQLRKA